MTIPEPTNEQRMDGAPAAQPARRGGMVRIVIGIVLLVLIVLGTLSNAATGQLAPSASGGVAEALGAVIGRLLFIAIGVVLLVSGIRARRRGR